MKELKEAYRVIFKQHGLRLNKVVMSYDEDSAAETIKDIYEGAVVEEVTKEN